MRSGLPDGLGWVHGTVHRWFIWYGTSLVFRVWYIVGVYVMVHRWCIWCGTSLVYMVWYIVDFYGTVHCWFLSKTYPFQ